jgi:hypothetical protein
MGTAASQSTTKIRMGHYHRIRGFGPKETMLAVGVVAVCAAILVPLYSRRHSEDLILSESARMRRIYVALTFYEEQFDTNPAPSLVAASIYDPNREDYLSERDPFRGSASPFPSDPALDNHENSPFRISFSYLENFVREKKVSIKPWAESRLDSKIGILADEWLGTVNPGPNWTAQVSGRVLRIGTDGAVFVLKDRGGPKPLGDPQDLFLRR